VAAAAAWRLASAARQLPLAGRVAALLAQHGSATPGTSLPRQRQREQERQRERDQQREGISR